VRNTGRDDQGTDIWQELEATGASITTTSSEAIAATLVKLLENIPAMKARAAAGREKILDWLAPEALAEQYEALYSDCINAQSSKPQ